jgi:hypothetical protein
MTEDLRIICMLVVVTGVVITSGIIIKVYTQCMSVI